MPKQSECLVTVLCAMISATVPHLPLITKCPNGAINCSYPCTSHNNDVVRAMTYSGQALQKRAWYSLLTSPIGVTFGAANAWGKLHEVLCVDCFPNDQHCYGSLACVRCAITTLYATGMAYYQWTVFVLAVFKRDGISSP